MSQSNKYIWPDNVVFETEAEKDFICKASRDKLLTKDTTYVKLSNTGRVK